DDHKLRAIGRIHDAAATRRSFDRARSVGFDNINLDLMYGLPDQSAAEAVADLKQALALGPEHLSWYQLTLEPKTEFARRPPRLPADVVMETMESAGHALLAAAGFTRYEVSAWTRPGHECRHNVNYWTFGDYVGIGAGAHGKHQGPGGPVRTRKVSQPRRYLAEPAGTDIAPIERRALPGEFMLNALRLTGGVPLEHFEAATGLPLEALEPARSRQIAQGLLRADRIAATERGYPVLDSLIQAYL
ncbi:MAG: coproporphyrinogen-III oxidase family protein, partial [Gammaproteobacteria bacterium]